MPAVKLLPDEKIGEMRSLREDGFSVRAISRLTGVPRATVHVYVRRVRVGESPPLLVENVAADVVHLGIHLPYRLVCPVCNEEQPHITFCLDCGAAWMGECGHGGDVREGRHEGIDLKPLRRTTGDGHLYVLPLEPDEKGT